MINNSQTKEHSVNRLANVVQLSLTWYYLK